MTVREYLNRGLVLQKTIQIKTEQLENITESMTNLSVSLEEIKVMKTPTTSKIENGVVQIVELKKEIEESIAKLAVIGEETIRVINKIEDYKTQSLLIKRYIGLKSFDAIATEMDLTYRTVLNMHQYAIGKLEKIMKDSPVLEDDDVA